MRKLRLGVVDQSPIRSGGTAADALRETLELARLADRLGYSRYWVAEHHNTSGFAGPSPEVLIPSVAAATSGIRVGSGGVMLSHYSAYKVAENFRVLETLYPGRIDLGVGRAPGGDLRTAQALRRAPGRYTAVDFPQQVVDMLGWLRDDLPEDHPHVGVRATPAGPGAPEVWLLGSGGDTAAFAAEVGCAYSFAQFISGLDGAPLLRAYRERFRPSPTLAAPLANVGVSVICAETSEEARRLASSLRLWRARLIQGADTPIPPPEEAEPLLDGMAARAGVPLTMRDPRLIAGDPDEVRDDLLAIAEHYDVDELMVVTITHDFAARVRSHELLAEAFGLEKRS